MDSSTAEFLVATVLALAVGVISFHMFIPENFQLKIKREPEVVPPDWQLGDLIGFHYTAYCYNYGLKNGDDLRTRDSILEAVSPCRRYIILYDGELTSKLPYKSEFLINGCLAGRKLKQEAKNRQIESEKLQYLAELWNN